MKGLLVTTTKIYFKEFPSFINNFGISDFPTNFSFINSVSILRYCIELCSIQERASERIESNFSHYLPCNFCTKLGYWLFFHKEAVFPSLPPSLCVGEFSLFHFLPIRSTLLRTSLCCGCFLLFCRNQLFHLFTIQCFHELSISSFINHFLHFSYKKNPEITSLFYGIEKKYISRGIKIVANKWRLYAIKW